MNRPRVLLISPWIKLGGSEYLILEEARRLADRGCEVAIAATYVDLAGLDRRFADLTFLLPPARIARLSRSRWSFFLLLGVPALFVIVFRAARRFDLLQAHNFPALWAAGVAAWIWRRPVFWHFNEPAPIPGPLLAVDGYLARRARGVTVLDTPSAARARSLFGIDSEVVRAGVDFKFWSQPKDSGGVRRLGVKPPFLLAVGKLHPQKNQVMLVEMLGLVPKDLDDLTLVVVGEGPDHARLQARARAMGISDRVLLAGLVTSETLRDLYREAFLACFPALRQTWGLTPFEALCQRTVSLVSAEAGVAEVLGPCRIGLVADPEPAAFAERIRFARAQPDELERMSEAGFSYTREHVSWDAFGDRMLELMSAP